MLPLLQSGWHRRSACRRRVNHAQSAERQHRRADHHDRRESRRHDTGRQQCQRYQDPGRSAERSREQTAAGAIVARCSDISVFMGPASIIA